MMKQLFGYQISAQENLKIYDDTFFTRKMEPDFVIRDNYSNVFVLDTKFKKMNFTNKDVDREDLYQTHTYGYYYDKNVNENLKMISLIYPSKSGPEDYDKLSDNLFGFNDNDVRFVISYLKEGKTYDEIRQNENDFIDRLRYSMV